MKELSGSDADGSCVEDSRGDSPRDFGGRFTLAVGSALIGVAEASQAANLAQLAVDESIANYLVDRARCAASAVAKRRGEIVVYGSFSAGGAPSSVRGESDSNAGPAEAADGSAPLAEVSGSAESTAASGTAVSAMAGSAIAVSATAGSATTISATAGSTASTGSSDSVAGETGVRLPELPFYAADQSFSEWVYDNADADDLAQIQVITGALSSRVSARAAAALTVVYGLPGFCARVAKGEYTAAHMEVVARACQQVEMRHLSTLDKHLTNRRADVSCETLRSSLHMRIRVLQPAEENYKQASRCRRARVVNYGDGQSCLMLVGPALEVNACYQRAEAMARAIHTGQVNTFGLSEQVKFDDDRGLGALMFDILTRSMPALSTRVVAVDPVTGVSFTREETPDAALRDDTAGRVAHCFAPAADGDPEEISRDIVLTLPTHDWWLSKQARLLVTVPFLTAFGDSSLPGTLLDGSPIPAETARRAVAHSPKLLRVLTDPATGTPIDSKAKTYQIPDNVRTTVAAKWRTCTVPGCTRVAQRCEIDHVEEFDHKNPEAGGLTTFMNLHSLCKRHHAFKTARAFDVVMPQSGLLEFTFSQGVTAEVHAPDSPIDHAQAREWWDLTHVEALPDWVRSAAGEKWGPAGERPVPAKVDDYGEGEQRVPTGEKCAPAEARPVTVGVDDCGEADESAADDLFVVIEDTPDLQEFRSRDRMRSLARNAANRFFANQTMCKAVAEHARAHSLPWSTAKTAVCGNGNRKFNDGKWFWGNAGADSGPSAANLNSPGSNTVGSGNAGSDGVGSNGVGSNGVGSGGMGSNGGNSKGAIARALRTRKLWERQQSSLEDAPFEAGPTGEVRLRDETDIFYAPIEGAEIIECDPIIISAKRAISSGEEVLGTVFAGYRRRSLLRHVWGRETEAEARSWDEAEQVKSGARVVDARTIAGKPHDQDPWAVRWEHDTGDPPPF